MFASSEGLSCSLVAHKRCILSYDLQDISIYSICILHIFLLFHSLISYEIVWNVRLANFPSFPEIRKILIVLNI